LTFTGATGNNYDSLNKHFYKKEILLYQLYVETHFDAAHQLVGYAGDCSNLHGHCWKVGIKVEAEKVDEIGLCIDFKKLKALTKEVVGRYDHQHLNNIAPFDKINPTAENLSRVIFEQLAEKLEENVELKEVTVWESEKCCVTYFKSC
jgi:6-pyruvoyltetrahydropterin/6-carboxytetrahydropterin synthase